MVVGVVLGLTAPGMMQGNDSPSAAQIFDRVLVAVGRRPNSIAWLDATTAKVNRRGFIEVDWSFRDRDNHCGRRGVVHLTSC